MSIGFDAVSSLNAKNVSAGSFNWNHTPGGTPKGVVVFTFVNANADDATAVTYGGVSLTAVTGGRAVDTAGEPGDCKVWFLGSGVPTGTQNIVVTRNNNANEMTGIAITVTSSQDSDIHTAGIVLAEGDQGLTEKSPTDGNSGTGDSLYVAGTFCGCDSFQTTAPSSPTPGFLYPGNNSTWRSGFDFLNTVCGVVTRTTTGTGAKAVGFISSNDDTAAVHFAIKDVVAGTARRRIFIID
jgi:hypothetical protein